MSSRNAFGMYELLAKCTNPLIGLHFCAAPYDNGEIKVNMGQGKRIGYKRVSTNEQNLESQLIGCELDKIFTEIESGYSVKNRHALNNLKEYVREDDIVFVECMDRLGRNGYDLDEIVEFLLQKGVQIHFVREGIILGKKNDLMSKLAYDMMKSFIHFFSQLAKERQRIGIDKAKKDGKYQGRKSKLTFMMIEKIKELMLTRKSKSEIADELKISRFTLYRYLSKMQTQTTVEMLCKT